MVQRSKRSLSPGKVEEMQREIKAFEWRVRIWSAEVPIASAVYPGARPAQPFATVDDSHPERRKGWHGF